METVYSILIIILFEVNLLLTLIVLKYRYLESFKKFAMTILIWLIPIAGLIWVWIILRTKNDQNGNNNAPILYGWFDSSTHDNSSNGSSDGSSLSD